MFQSVCFLAFCGNCIMMLISSSNGDWLGVLFHLFCAGLCSIGFIEFKNKGVK